MKLRDILLSLNKDKEYHAMIEKADMQTLIECWRIFCKEADEEINKEVIRSMKLR